MDDLLRQVLMETKRLSQLDQPSDYEPFERLVELRQSLTDKVAQKGSLTAEEKRLIREILHFDPVMMGHMQRLKEEANQALGRLSTFKKQKAAYHSRGLDESIIFDKRN